MRIKNKLTGLFTEVLLVLGYCALLMIIAFLTVR